MLVKMKKELEEAKLNDIEAVNDPIIENYSEVIKL
jgi:hypothetical protein